MLYFHYNHENRECQLIFIYLVYFNIMKVFGERLRELRTAKGITQKQFAKLLNVSGNTVHCWETDKQEPSMSMLLYISEYFEVSLDYLFGRIDY